MTPSNRKPRGDIVLLIAFAIMYLVPLVWSPGPVHTMTCVGIALAVVGSSAMVLMRVSNRGLVPTRRAASFVQTSAVAEFFVVLGGLAVGLVWNQWWLLGPMILSSVAVHFLALTIAFRRPIDFLLLPTIIVAVAISWLADRSDMVVDLGYAGALASGACLSYVNAMMRRR